MQASSFGLCQMACVLKATVNPQLSRPSSLKEVAGLKEQAEFLLCVQITCGVNKKPFLS